VWGVVILALLVVLVLSSFLPHNSAKSLTYTTFLNDGKAKQVQSANVDNSTGTITGKLSNGTSYTVSGRTRSSRPTSPSSSPTAWTSRSPPRRIS